MIVPINAELLRAAFSYDPETGSLIRISGKNKGSRAGSTNGNGYVTTFFNGRSFMVHRLAWCLVHGRDATSRIDHINGDRADNRIANLRAASPSQNAANRRCSINNSLGFKGVSRASNSSTFRAQIHFENRQIFLGCFPTAEEAHAAYVKASVKYFGEFARIA